QGKETAKLVAKASPNDPNDKPAEEPQPTPPKPAPKPEPPPPPPPPPPPLPPTPPKPAAAAPEPPPKPEPPKPAPAKPEPPPPPRDQGKPPRAGAPPEPTPDTPPPPREAPKPPEPAKPAEPVKTAAIAPPLPRIRPRPPSPPIDQKRDFDDKITALLAKSDTPPATQSDSPATVGTSKAKPDPAMTQNELDALKAKIESCWIVPQGAASADEVRTGVTIRFNRDGSLQGEPEVTARPSGRYNEIAPASVVRAIIKCAPYSLPAEKYAGENGWNAVAI